MTTTAVGTDDRNAPCPVCGKVVELVAADPSGRKIIRRHFARRGAPRVLGDVALCRGSGRSPE